MEDMENQILAIEERTNKENVATLKRTLPTLKGEAGVLDLSDIARACHKTEDYMETAGDKISIDKLLMVKDWVLNALKFYAEKGPSPESVDDLLSRLLPSSQEIPDTIPEEPGGKIPEIETSQKEEKKSSPGNSIFGNDEGSLELISDFVSEAKEHLDVADAHVLTLETEPENEEAMNALFRAFHTIKGAAGFMELENITTLAHEAENLLDQARKGEILLADEAIDVTFDAVDMLKEMIDGLGESLKGGAPPDLGQSLRQLLSRIKSAVLKKSNDEV